MSFSAFRVLFRQRNEPVEASSGPRAILLVIPPMLVRLHLGTHIQELLRDILGRARSRLPVV